MRLLSWFRGLVADWRTLRKQRRCGYPRHGHAWLYHAHPPRGARYSARHCNVCGVIESARYDNQHNTIFGWGDERKICPPRERHEV
jgi:hypothetical protein